MSGPSGHEAFAGILAGMLALLLSCLGTQPDDPPLPEPAPPSNEVMVPLSWGVPPCVIEYEVKGTLKRDMVDPPRSQTTTLGLSLLLQPAEEGLVLHGGEEHRPVPLSVVGGRIISGDGVHPLWSSLGGFEGMRLLFPPLPVDQTGLWTRHVSTNETSGESSNDDEGITISGTIRHEGVVVLEDVPAQHLTGQWSATVERAAQIEVVGSAEWWLVDGVLAAAQIRDRRTIVSNHDFDAGPVTVTQVHEMSLEVARRAGCAVLEAGATQAAEGEEPTDR